VSRGTVDCCSPRGSTQSRVDLSRHLRPCTHKRDGGGGTMDVLYGCCGGLDVHKKTVVACLIRAAGSGPVRKEIRTFGTTVEELGDLRAWLAAAGCEAVAMESTGVYWKPIYNLLEGHFFLLVVNAAHIKAVCRGARPT